MSGCNRNGWIRILIPSFKIISVNEKHGKLSAARAFISLHQYVSRFHAHSQQLAGPIAIYGQLVSSGTIREDSHQLEALKHFQNLYEEIILYDHSYNNHYGVNQERSLSNPQSSAGRLSSWMGNVFGDRSNDHQTGKHSVSNSSFKVSSFLRQSKTTPKSLYIYGGTGCGKTYLMDLFFENLSIHRKKRVHFHNFMIYVHKRLHRLKMNGLAQNAMATITQELITDAYVICFDEFQVTDIADAMILKSLFTSLLDSGAVLIATSNRPPTDLYQNGLQRSLFLPFIDLLMQKAIVHSLTASKVDYRLVKNEQLARNAYLYPASGDSKILFDNQFEELRAPDSYVANSSTNLQQQSPMCVVLLPVQSMNILVYGHNVIVPEVILGRRVARFQFDQLCDIALGAADYIELGKLFNVIFISDVPAMSIGNRNVMRRFINCIDAFYEAQVKLVITAAVEPTGLLRLTQEERDSNGYDELFAFDRTVSRLLEMQSRPYIEATMQQHPTGSDKVGIILKGFIIGNGKYNTVTTEEMVALWNYYHIAGQHDNLVTKEAISRQVLKVAIRDLIEFVRVHDLALLKAVYHKCGLSQTKTKMDQLLLDLSDIDAVLVQSPVIDWYTFQEFDSIVRGILLP